MNRGIPFVIFGFMHSFSVQSLCLLQNRNMNINPLVLLHTQGITPLIQYYIIIKYFKSINKEEFSVHYNLKQIYLLSSSVIISSFSLSLFFLLLQFILYTTYVLLPPLFITIIFSYHILLLSFSLLSSSLVYTLYLNTYVLLPPLFITSFYDMIMLILSDSLGENYQFTEKINNILNMYIMYSNVIISINTFPKIQTQLRY